MKTYQVLIASDLNKKYQGIDFSSKLLPAIVPPGMPPVMMPPEILSKSAPYYNQLSMNAWNFAWSVVCENPEKQDKERIRFHMCNMLYFREEIIKKFGCRRNHRGIMEASQIHY